MPDMRPPPGLGQDTSEFESQYIHMGDDDGSIDFTTSLGPHAAVDSAMGDEKAEPQHQQPTQHMTHQPQQRSHSQSQGTGQSASDTATAALAYHTMTVPQPTENAFMNQPTAGAEGGDQAAAGSGEPGTQQRTSSFGEMEPPATGANGEPGSPNATGSTPIGGKPTVGSEEWHKVRRDNHKEGAYNRSSLDRVYTDGCAVERRRRETINEGINELAKIVPGCEKNKGSILARAVQFITQLKENETQNIEKWTLEKLLTEQAIAELSSSCDKLKSECQRAWTECEQWKKAAQKAGVSIEDAKASADAEEAD